MVKIQKLIPQVYYDSRDFQVLARSLEIIANYCKTNADLIRNVPISRATDNKLIELLSNHLGFNNKFTYSSDELSYLMQIFRKLIRNKGTVYAIETLIKNVFLSQGLDEGFTISEEYYNSEVAIRKLSIIFSKDIGEIEVQLIQEVLDYIFPIGCIFNIQNAKVATATEAEIHVGEDYISAWSLKDSSSKLISNVSMTSLNSNFMWTTDIKNQGDKYGAITNPVVGNIKASRVMKTRKGK